MIKKGKIEQLKKFHEFHQEELDVFDVLNEHSSYQTSDELYNLYLNEYMLYKEKIGKSIKDNNDSSVMFDSLETYPILKLKALKACLEDILIGAELSDANTDISNKYSTYLKVIVHIMTLNSVDDLLYEDENFSRIMVYGYNNNNKIGRLYPKRTSVQSLNREIRYYLFYDLYEDVGLVNAHPTILFDHARLYKIECPVLQDFVQNRNVFLEKVKNEINPSITDLSFVKQEILATINKVFYDGDSLSLNILHIEIIKIRDSIWYNNFLTEKNSPNLSVLKDRQIFSVKSIEKKKTTVQSIYCFSKETDLLIDLRQFLLKNVTDLAEKPYSKNNYFRSYNHVSEKVDFRFIPFFDGAYIHIKSPIGLKIDLLLEDYNKTQDLFKFKKKTIEPNWTLLTKDCLSKYEILITFLAKLKSEDFKKLLISLDYKEFIISEDLQMKLKKSYVDFNDKRDNNNLLLKTLNDDRKNLLREFKKWSKDNKITQTNILDTDFANTNNFKLSVKQIFFMEDIKKRLEDIDLNIINTKKDLSEDFVSYDYDLLNTECRHYEYYLRKKLLPYSSDLTKLNALLSKV